MANHYSEPGPEREDFEKALAQLQKVVARQDYELQARRKVAEKALAAAPCVCTSATQTEKKEPFRQDAPRPPTLPTRTALELEEARRQLATLDKLLDQAYDERLAFASWPRKQKSSL